MAERRSKTSVAVFRRADLDRTMADDREFTFGLD